MHLIVLLLVVGILAAVVGFVVWLLARASPSVAKSSATTELRLRELSNLKAKGLITDGEFERQRAAIMGNV
jgi:cytochrome c-type biogenesis protein CcmH/NrfG